MFEVILQEHFPTKEQKTDEDHKMGCLTLNRPQNGINPKGTRTRDTSWPQKGTNKL